MKLQDLDRETVELLKRSRKQQGFLVPIVKDQYGNILSGRHRKKADEGWSEQVLEVESELDRLLKIVHFNVQRRPSQQETAQRLLAIAKILEKQGIEKPNICSAISKIVPYKDQHVRRLLPDEYKHIEFRASDFQPQLYNVWNFQSCDERFGTPDYAGKIPGQIVQNTLYYYTAENDLVVDPMAGGGTTIDVCRSMNRRYFAYDINPCREDIKQNDILTGIPEEAHNCNLIFLDPPYYKKKEEEYGANSISAQSRENFMRSIETIARHCFVTVADNGVVTVLISDFLDYENDVKSLLAFEYAKIFLETGFKAVNHIAVPLSPQQWKPYHVNQAKENKYMLETARDLFVFRKC